MPTLDTVLETMLKKSRRKLQWAALKANTLSTYLMQNDKIELEDGGYQIQNPMIVGRNPNVASARYYDPWPMGQTNEFLNIEYTYTRIGGSLIISEQELDEAQGEGAQFKLLPKKMEVLQESIEEKFDTMLHGTGLGDDVYGLEYHVPEDPTTGTVGGKSRAAHPELRTSSYAYNGSIQPSNIEEMLKDTLTYDLNNRREKVDLMIMGRNFQRIYDAAARRKFSIDIGLATKNGKRMIDLGFDASSFGNVTILYDEGMHPDKMYFLNTKHIRLHVFKHVNMKVKKLTAPWDLDVIGRRILWQGQLCFWNFHRKHAVATNYGWQPEEGA